MSQVWEKWQDEFNGMMSKLENLVDLSGKESTEEPTTLVAETENQITNVDWIDFGVI